jgi:hypothetical protein
MTNLDKIKEQVRQAEKLVENTRPLASRETLILLTCQGGIRVPLSDWATVRELAQLGYLQATQETRSAEPTLAGTIVIQRIRQAGAQKPEKRKPMTEPFADLQEWWDNEHDQFITDLITVLSDNERDENGMLKTDGFTFQEIREHMEAHFNAAYDPDMRHLECLPTQRQVNRGIEELLTIEDRAIAYTDDNRIFLRHDDLEEHEIKKAILERLEG